MSEKYYENIRIHGVWHYVAAMAVYKTERNKGYLKAMLCSFKHKQEHDQLLSAIQKSEISFPHKGTRVYTVPKSYISNVSRCKNDNQGDGYHSLIYSTEENVILVSKGESAVDKVYEYLISNFKSGILPEWKDYYFKELTDLEFITKCDSFDYTGYLPEVYIADNIDTELLRNLKADGLKKGKIVLDVPEYEELDPTKEFVDLLNDYIIPNISNEKAYFNLGEETIHPLLESPIKKENKVKSLFSMQQIMAQGMLNYLEQSGYNAVIFNGGTGIGKTWTTCKLSYAIVDVILKKKNAYIGVMCQKTLLDNWKNGFIECLTMLGINPKITIITNYADIKKLPKEPEGINIIIMPKDTIKMQYIKGHCAIYKNKNIDDVITFVRNLGKSKSFIGFEKCTLDKSRIKLAVAQYSNQMGSPIVLYSADEDSNGKKCYRFATNCKTLLEKYGTTHKSYDFTTYSLSEVKNFINANKDKIKEEKITVRINGKIDPTLGKNMLRTYTVCPYCGGKIYENDKHCLDIEGQYKNLTEKYKNAKNDKLSICKNYVKADGSTITEEEFNHIRIRNNYIIVDEPTKTVYLDEFEKPITEPEEITNCKRLKDKNGNEVRFKMQIRLCGHPMFGYTEAKGRRSFNTGKYIRKIHGKDFFDVCIFDEFHELNNQNQQGETMAYLCKSSKYQILLSGTISEGRASNLYYTFWRVFPRKMIELGYNYEDEAIFIDHYGRRKRVQMRGDDDNYESTGSGIGKIKFKKWEEIPGVSPLLYNNFLSGTMVSRKIEDMHIPLPKVVYIKEEVEMSNEQKSGYSLLKQSMTDFMKRNPKIGLGNTYILRLKSYPDMPNQDAIYATVKNKYNKKKKEESIYVCTPTPIDLTNQVLPKDKRLIVTLLKEIKQNRKCIVYTENVNKLGVAGRLYVLLSKYFKVKFLASSTTDDKYATKVDQELRESTIRNWAKQGVQVIICNPALVKTGLNLIEYPTIYFYDQPYKISLLRQAEMRAYRPNQTRECRIYYSFYKDCIQEDAIKLIGTKKRAALAIEGVFSNDILSSMGDGGDSIESQLNKVLNGKIVLKESDLDSFNFETIDYEEEEVEVAVDSANVIDVKYQDVSKMTTTLNPIKTTDNTSQTKVNRADIPVTNTMFKFDSDFMNKIANKVKNKKEVAATSTDTEQISFF